VSGRASQLVLAAGFVVVLALAIGLVQLTRSPTGAATPQFSAYGPTATPPTPVAEVPASRTSSSAPRELHSASPMPHGRGAMPVQQPELAPAPVGFRRELKRDADGHLVPIISVDDLREQLPRIDAPMKACIQRSGQRPTGKATLNFTVAAKNNKLIIETTGVQDEETLAGYPELLACMHQTANAFSLEGRPVPELGTPIYVRRHVRLENGELAENSIFDFSYNP
jgi:hypothetical protein